MHHDVVWVMLTTHYVGYVTLVMTSFRHHKYQSYEQVSRIDSFLRGHVYQGGSIGLFNQLTGIKGNEGNRTRHHHMYSSRCNVMGQCARVDESLLAANCKRELIGKAASWTHCGKAANSLRQGRSTNPLPQVRSTRVCCKCELTAARPQHKLGANFSQCAINLQWKGINTSLYDVITLILTIPLTFILNKFWINQFYTSGITSMLTS